MRQQLPIQWRTIMGELAILRHHQTAPHWSLRQHKESKPQCCQLGLLIMVAKLPHHLDTVCFPEQLRT